MITYFSKDEFEKVLLDTLVEKLYEHKAKSEDEFSRIYFYNSPDIEYGIRGKAVLKTSYNNNGYFIVPPQNKKI